jgi:hypothetical protein
MTMWPSAIWLLLTLGFVEPSAQPQVPSDPWFKMSQRPRDFRQAPLPWKTFTVEVPNGWQLTPGYNSILFTAAEKVGSNLPAASIVFEHTALPEPLGPNDVDANLAGNEADYARGRDPGNQKVEQDAKEVNQRRFMLIQYSRNGFFGMDRVAVYVFPAGRVMYRLICIAPEKEFVQKYQPIFAHVAWSFKPAIADAK